MADHPQHNITETVFLATKESTLKDHLLFEKLSQYINYLVKNDFDRLVSLLYRIDINENKLKELLKTNAGIDSGKIIATSIIERQLQKIMLRRENQKNDSEIEEDEKW